MRKIALISEHASPLAAPGSVDSGGQNIYVAHLAIELARLGHQVDVFTRRDDPHLPQIVDWQPNVRVIHVPAGPARFIPKEQMLGYMDAFGKFMVRFAKRQNRPYDAVHANFFMSGIAASHCQKSLGIPFVITFHALGKVRRLCQGQADGFPESRMAIEAQLMREADCVVAECEQDRDDMLKLYNAPKERIDIVPCGFDPGEFWPVTVDARRRLQLDEHEFTVLQLGRMVPRKGVDNVIDAIGLLRQRHGIDARLIVVGGNSPLPDPALTPEIGRLSARAQTAGVAGQVTFIGQVERQKLRYFYSAADVFVTTPWYEPFGITPLEAMACGTPVVGSNVGGIKSTVVDGQTGWLVPPNAPEKLAERLAWLHNHPHAARRFGWAGMRRVYQQYTWRNVAEQVDALYQRVCADRRPERRSLQSVAMQDGADRRMHDPRFAEAPAGRAALTALHAPPGQPASRRVANL